MTERLSQARVFVKDKEGQSVEQIALRRWDVQGKIHWPAARFRISQFFENTGDKPLELVYTFPLASDQLLESFEVYINDQHVVSRVVAAEEAEELYEEAVLSGDSAFRLQQHRTNVFTLNIGNLGPAEWVRVDFHLCQLLEVKSGRIQVRVPTVVGPRYIPGNPIGPATGLGWAPPTDQVPDADWITPPFEFNGVPYTVSALFEITPSLKITGIESPSHPFQVKMDGDTYWAVMGDELKADRDIVLNLDVEPNFSNRLWQVSYDSRQIAVVSLGGNDSEKRESLPRDVVFLIDISGSMCGEKLATTVKGVKLCLRKLRPKDRFQLFAFESDLHFWRPPEGWVEFTEEILKDADRWLSTLESLGGTELFPALEAALQLPAEPGRQKVIVLLTDGEVGNESQLVELTRRFQPPPHMLLFGIDTAVNQHLFHSLKQVAPALSEFIFPGQDINRAVNVQFQMLERNWVTGIDIVGGNKTIQARDRLSQFPFPLAPHSRTTLFLEVSNTLNKVEALKINLDDGTQILLPMEMESDFATVQEILLKFWAKHTLEKYQNDREQQNNTTYQKHMKRLALELQLESPFTNFITVLERDEKIEEIPQVRVIPVAFPHLWEEGSFCAASSYRRAYLREVFSRDASLRISAMRKHGAVKLNRRPMQFFMPDGAVKLNRRPGHFSMPVLSDLSEPEGVFIDLLMQQQADGSFQLSSDKNSAVLDTLTALCWIFQKEAEGDISLDGYEANLGKALQFLVSRKDSMMKTEWRLWCFIYHEFSRQLSLTKKYFNVSAMDKQKPFEMDLPERHLTDLKKLFFIEKLPKGKKYKSFTRKLLKILEV